MKHFHFLLLLLLLVAACPVKVQSQNSLGDFFSRLFPSSQSSTASTVTSVFNHLIGNKAVSTQSLVGTWTYSQPAVAFESDNLLSKAGGAVTAKALEKKLGDALSKYGYKAGYSTFTFRADSTFSIKINSKTLTGRYAVSESTLSLYTRYGTRIVTANVAISGSQLQVTFTANKLLTFVNHLSSLSSASSSLATLSRLAGNYSGMQLGLQFKKQ